MRRRILDSIALRDGRTLAYAEYGDPAGVPVVFFHGLGHDRLAVGPAGRGVRLICVDRPGLGASTRRHDRTIAAFAADVEDLLDTLRIETFRAVAWSAGAPYALACCAALPSRVVAATIAGGMAPPHANIEVGAMDPFAALMLRLASWSPRATVAPLGFLRLQAQLKGELLLRTLFASAPACDKRALAEPAIKSMFIETYRSSTSNGIGGLLDDLSLLARAWGVDLAAVDGTKIALVYGELDRLTPAPVGIGLARLLPGSDLRIVPGLGHMLLWTEWSMLVAELVGRGTERSTAGIPRQQGDRGSASRPERNRPSLARSADTRRLISRRRSPMARPSEYAHTAP